MSRSEMASGATAQEEFKAKLTEVRADRVRRSAGMLTAAASEAVRTLLSLQKESVPAPVRLGAARTVLEIGVKLREMADFETRLAELEAQVRAFEPPVAAGWSP